jgi:site-specific DNA recombinase
MRCALYARFSSDLQRDTSIDDQIAVARRFANAHGWTVDPACIFSDAAISGASLDRPGIQALLAAAARQPRPFDVVLVDDSSRVARDLADAVRFMQQLTFLGIRVICISQNIDSASEQAETLVAVHGVVDSLYLREMSKRVKRGLAGQLERGYATGSATYGYRTIPEPDPTGKRDPHGYPVLLGNRVEIQPEEARVIAQIFEWYAAGQGTGRIVERLDRAGTTGPRGRRWKHGVVTRILVNEKYIGQRIWGQRRFEREPGTQRRVVRALPRDQWHVQDRPDLRIISADLWDSVQKRRAAVREVLAASGTRTLMRGRNAALHSKYLFSGFMRCAICGSKITVQHGGCKGCDPRYGCYQSWRNGVTSCPNRLTIRASVTDNALLAALPRELLTPATLRYVSAALAAELNRRINDRPQLETEARAARGRATERVRRLVAAIEDGAPAHSLVAAIREREGEIERLDAQIAELAEPIEGRLAVLPGWVRQQLSDLAGLLTDTPERAKAEFQRLKLAITLHVVRSRGRAFYRADARADLPWLAGTHDLSGSAVGRSHRQSRR